jgi:hypothetical protein
VEEQGEEVPFRSAQQITLIALQNMQPEEVVCSLVAPTVMQTQAQQVANRSLKALSVETPALVQFQRELVTGVLVSR